MYYDIEVINNININVVVIFITRTNDLMRDYEGTLVLNSYPDSHFCTGCAEQVQNLL